MSSVMPTAPPAVLVVDDDACLRAIVSDWLEHAGFHTRRLCSGEACISAVAAERPVAVILDLHMSGMSGRETLDELRRIREDVPVIALSGEQDPEEAAALIESGADEFLLKPVRRARLVESLLALVHPVPTPAPH